jgi:hypothetical protein
VLKLRRGRTHWREDLPPDLGAGNDNPRVEVDHAILRAFIRTAMWRGWRGGYLLARPGLSKWFWSAEPLAETEGLTRVDLGLIREVDEMNICRYLADVLGQPLAIVGAAMGIKHIYGPHHNEVDVRLRRAQDWGTAELDSRLAERCIQEHLLRVSGDREAPGQQVVWDYPPAAASGQAESDLDALYGLCIARRVAETRAWGLGLQLGVILVDATRTARIAVRRRTGTAWLWERPISCFKYDAAWVGVGGDWSGGATGNPFSPTRALYAMGVSFYLERSVAYLYAATA